MPVPSASGQVRCLRKKWHRDHASEEEQEQAHIWQATRTAHLCKADCGREHLSRMPILTPGQLMKVQGVPFKYNEFPRDTDWTEDVNTAAGGNYQRTGEHETASLPTAGADAYPSVAKTLLHERIETDLPSLLQELMRSASGRVELQCALHAGVERGLLQGSNCSLPGITGATTDEALLRGFWTAHSSGRYAETPTNGVNPPLQLQQLCGQGALQFRDTPNVAPQDQGRRSAHVGAHNRPEALHLCRLLGSNGMLVHVPYTPYEQTFSKRSGHAQERP